VVHITPHLGGGVGRVLLGWLGRERADRHSVYCLDDISDDSTKKAKALSLSVRSAMGRDLPGLMAAVASADVVLVHWWNNPGLYRLLVNETFPPCRLVVWSHVAGHAAPQVFTRSLVGFPDRFVAATPWSLESPVIAGLDPAWRSDHVRLIFTCAGTETGERALRVPHDGFVIGYVGTVDYCKLHPSFVSMSANAEIRDARFVVCGGDRHEEIGLQAKARESGDRFVFTGPVRNVSDYLGVFDVFGYPLGRDHYGTGEQALIEAMAAGLPVVVFDNGSERHLVEHGETGLVVKNEQEYTAALENLHRDETLRRRLGDRARERARSLFSLDTMVKGWRTLLHETAGLQKQEHCWPGDRPLHGAALFMESLGDAATWFRQSVKSGGTSLEAHQQIANLSGAHRAATRGSAFHYRALYPRDPYLNLWCGLLEREMGNGAGAEDSFTVARKNGLEHASPSLAATAPVLGQAMDSLRSDRPCPLCGKHEARVLTRLRFALFEGNPLAPEFPWVACAACGFSYYATPSTEADFDAYYRANAYYASAATSGSGGSHRPDIVRYDAIAECLGRHIEDKTTPLFDVGSGKGGLLLRLQSAGFPNLYAIDMVEGCTAFIRDNCGFHAATGSAARLPFPNVTPGALVYSHVLEHAYNPGAILDEAYNRLTDNGLMYCEVPDAARYGEYQNVPWADLYFEHINHFDEAHLAAQARAHGFETVETGARDLDTATGNVVPCIYGVFRKARQERRNPENDQELATHCRIYVDACGQSPMFARLETLAREKTPVYVWGMSQFGQLLLGQTALGRCAIKALVDGDKNKQGKKISGMPVQAPDVLCRASKKDVVVLTGIACQKQMRDYLKEIEFKGSEYALE
jgi:glycosyltransferase involved in cell wall biosynthesis